MKTGQKICLSLFLLVCALSGARGEDYRTDINPALLYYQSFLVAPKVEDYYNYLNTNTWDFGQQLPAQYGSSVSNFNAELEFVREAAQQTAPCDWGIDFNRHGADTLLPYLGMAKRAVVDSQYQIAWDLQNGNEARARDDLLADLTLGRHVSTTHVLIAALVEIAIENFVCDEIAQHFHEFSSGTLQQLADGFDAAPPRVTVTECVPTERIIHQRTLSRFEDIQKQYAGDNDGAMEALHRLFFYYSADQWEQLTNATGNTIDGATQQVRDLELYYPKVESLMALPYREYSEQLPAYQSQFRQSGNPFILLGFPPLVASRSREFAVEVDLAMVRAAIEYKLHGDAGLNSVMDPCGNGPFTMKRFYLNGVDRGFELQSALNRGKGPESFIFVEKSGPAFHVTGNRVGQASSK